MVALHAVKKSGDGILQSFEKLLVVLLRFSILILLLKEQNKNRDLLWVYNIYYTDLTMCFQYISSYLHYVDWLDRDMTFNRLANGWDGFSQWHRGRR